MRILKNFKNFNTFIIKCIIFAFRLQINRKQLHTMDAKILTEMSKDRVQKVAKYLTIIVNLNREHFIIKVKGVEKIASITEQDIQVLAYAAVAGDISTMKSRSGCQNYLKISRHSLNNAISKLQRVGLLIKTDRTRINPGLKLDFSKDIHFTITFNEQTGNS